MHLPHLTFREELIMKHLFSISLMCMDFLHIKEQLDVLNRYGDIYHADIMDGHFCKNITLSPGFIKSIRPALPLPVEAHLMVTQPNDFLVMLAKTGVEDTLVSLLSKKCLIKFGRPTNGKVPEDTTISYRLTVHATNKPTLHFMVRVQEAL